MTTQKPFDPMGFGDGERYAKVFKQIADGSFTKLSNEQLIEAARSLATYHFNHAGQDQEAAALLIHSMLLERTVRDVERTVRDVERTMVGIDQSNAKTQRLVIVLALVAIAVGLMQVGVAIFPHICAK